jgi:hypothetical protein
MSLQTETMRELAGDQQYITAAQHKNTNQWHGILVVNHPTPSGCDRWMVVYSDNRGWDTPSEALDKFVEASPAFKDIKRGAV